MRPVLLGMNNPISSTPGHELFPHPTGCTGWRVWQLLRLKDDTITRRQYLNGFERVNLVRGLVWDRTEADRAASNLPSLYSGRIIVVFGEECRRAIGLPKLLVHPIEQHGVTWRQLPHPSGRCTWYNDEEARDLAASLLIELYRGGK